MLASEVVKRINDIIEEHGDLDLKIFVARRIPCGESARVGNSYEVDSISPVADEFYNPPYGIQISVLLSTHM